MFACPASHSLCHCISTDIAMGKGIATAFKAKFGGVAELKAQKKAIGQVATLRKDDRYIYYLVPPHDTTPPPHSHHSAAAPEGPFSLQVDG